MENYKHYHIRVRTDLEKRWEESFLVAKFGTWEAIVNSAYSLSRLYQCEVRVNESGSSQGHYFLAHQQG